MKQTLIRLHSEDLKGVFRTQFKDIITIKPNSQVALQSCSVNRQNTTFIIDGSNDTIQFQLHTLKQNVIRLPHGVYNRTTAITDLFGAIIEEMNKTLSISDDIEFGCQYNLRVNILNRIEIEVVKQTDEHTAVLISQQDPGTNDFFFTHNITATIATDELKSTSGAVADNLTTSYIVDQFPWIKGCGVLRTRLKHYNTGGILIGLIAQSDVAKAKSGELQKSDIKFGIETGTNIGDNYIGYVNGVATDTGTAPLKASAPTLNDNDVLDIRLSNGFIQVVVEQDGNTLNISSTEYRTAGQADPIYHSFIAFKGTTQIDSTIVTIDPFSTQNRNPQLHFVNNTFTAPNPPENNNDADTIQFNLTFDGVAIANFLGFNVPFLTDAPEDDSYIGAGKLYSFISPNKLDNLIPPDRFIIELLNIPINSYDSLTGGRKNILASVPIVEKEDAHNFVIDYEPNSYTFISLNNRDELRLRNIDARVLTDEFNEFATEGFNTISLLIREESD